MTKPNPNAELFEWIEWASTFILANLLWVMLALPVITLPMATAGLFATMAPWSRGKPSEVFREFFRALRQYWLKASVIGLIDGLIGAWVVLNFSIFRLMDSQPLMILSQIVTLFVTMMALMANLYIWPLLVTFDLPLRNLLMTSVKLVFVHPLWSLGLLVLVAGLFIISLFFPAAVLLLASFSAAALLINRGAWRVMRRYVPEDELPRYETRPQHMEAL